MTKELMDKVQAEADRRYPKSMIYYDSNAALVQGASYLYSLLPEGEQTGCRWVKASERLPEIGWKGFFIYEDDDGRFNKAGKFIGGEGLWTGFVGEGNYDVRLSKLIRWLDESEPTPSTGSDKGQDEQISINGDGYVEPPDQSSVGQLEQFTIWLNVFGWAQSAELALFVAKMKSKYIIQPRQAEK